MKIQTIALRLAHQIKDQFDNWRDAVKTAWNRVRLLTAISDGPKNFVFAKKKTGEIRKALGFVDRPFKHVFKSGYDFNKFCVITFKEIVTKIVDGVEQTIEQFRRLDIRFLISIEK